MLISRLRALPPVERRDLWPAFWRLLVVRLLLIFGIRRCAGWLDGRAVDNNQAFDLALWQRRALALRRTGTRLPGVECLARSLALRWWMRGAGIEAAIHIGVRSESGTVHSHAWVEADSTVIDDLPEHTRQFRIIQTF